MSDLMSENSYELYDNFVNKYLENEEAIYENFSLFVFNVDKVLFNFTNGDYKKTLNQITNTSIPEEFNILFKDFVKVLNDDKANGFEVFLNTIDTADYWEKKKSKSPLLLHEDIDFKKGTYNLLKSCDPISVVKFIKVLYVSV